MGLCEGGGRWRNTGPQPTLWLRCRGSCPPTWVGGSAKDPPSDETTQREYVYPQDAYEKQQGPSGKKRRTVKVIQYQYAKREPIYRVGPNAERVSVKDFKKIKKRLDAVA